MFFTLQLTFSLLTYWSIKGVVSSWVYWFASSSYYSSKAPTTIVLILNIENDVALLSKSWWHDSSWVQRINLTTMSYFAVHKLCLRNNRIWFYTTYKQWLLSELQWWFLVCSLFRTFAAAAFIVNIVFPKQFDYILKTFFGITCLDDSDDVDTVWLWNCLVVKNCNL